MKSAIAVTVLVALFGAALSAKDMAEGAKEILTYAQLGGDWPGLCQTGTVQSPINVVVEDLQPIKNPAGMVKVDSLGVVRQASLFVTEKLPHVELTWQKFVEAPQATVPARKSDGDVFAPATGEVDPEDLTQVAIEAVQCHIHTPSENAVDGSTADGVIHCVHFVKDGESEKCDALKAAGGLGCPVVISIFLNGDGLSSPLNNALKTPLEEGGEGGYAEVLTPAVTEVGRENGVRVRGRVNLSNFLPESGEYATWPGSLTTAPCTEGVLWVQMLKPVSVPAEQIAYLEDSIAFATGSDCKEVKDGQCFPPRLRVNNRELQNLNGRVLRKGIAF